MMRVDGRISVAALVAHECLHGARTLWAFHGLRDLSSNAWDVKAAAVPHSLNHLLVVCFEREFKTLLLYEVLPCVEVIEDLQDCEAVASHHHSRPFSKHSPSTLIFVGKQLLDFFGHSVSLLVDFGEEQALNSIPKSPENSKVFSAFRAPANTKYLNIDLQFLDEGVIGNRSCFLCELLDPVIVFASIEEDVLLLFDLFEQRNKNYNLKFELKLVL